MVIIGVLNGVVEICVSINDDQMSHVIEMYPNHFFIEQSGNETIGWTYDGVSFTAPIGG
jgi:hypothetical protein